MKTQTFRVQGMHCASCQTIIAKKIRALPDVESCEVNFASEKATIQMKSGDVPVEKINHELKPFGYHFTTESDTSARQYHNQAYGMDHQEQPALSQGKQEKLDELEKQKGRVQFVLPISLLVFVFEHDATCERAAICVNSGRSLP